MNVTSATAANNAVNDVLEYLASGSRRAANPR